MKYKSRGLDEFFKFRKLDYILFYLIIISVLFIVQLSELLLTPVVGILIGATIPALTLGTITNLIFKRSK
ncbi:MAG: hypothetical protein U0Z74_03810 [Romboutsia timonensis]